MKKFTIMLSALLAFGSLQSFAQDAQADPQAEKPSTKSEFNGTGYYRLRNAETGRYLKVYGDVFKTEFTEQVAIFNTGSSINLINKYSEVVSDPGTVLFVEDLGEAENGSGITVTNIEVKSQGTGLVENLNYDDMNASLKDFGIDGTEPQVSIRKTGEKVNGKETFFIETFQDFGPLAVKAVATARSAAAAGVPGAAERLAKLLEFAEKVAGHQLDYRALARVTGLKFIDLNNNKLTGAGDFTISYDYTDPANHIIFIGKEGVREDKDSKAAQWFIEPILADENVFGVQNGASVKDDKQLEITGNYFYQTLYVDFPFEIDGVNTKAYYGTALNGNTLTMDLVPGTIVPARTPVLIEFANQNAHQSQCTPWYVEGEEAPALPGENLLGGVIYLNHSLSCTSPKTISEEDMYADGAWYDLDNIDKYVFGYSDQPVWYEGEKRPDILGFYEYTSAWLANNKAYLKLNGAPVKGAIRISLGDKELTAINGVITESAPKAIYDLSGRRVENPTTGLYIVNGKKVLVK
ncbi:MAG: hypothetical protein J6T52_13490 [Bacteroidaceae bacterium]|nr:hypothetical protein [Bacteroidaceae bacterium]